MSERSGEPVRVLHVDDDPEIVDPSGTLEAEHDRLDVERATSADEAAERITRGGIDCVVSAVDPAEGIELLERVREDRPALPVVLFTGEGGETVAISAGVTDSLQTDRDDPYARLAESVVEAVAASSRDVTDRRDRERKLEALHDATRHLAHAESHGAIAEITVETARDVLDMPISGLYLYDGEEAVLEPAAITDEATALLDDIPVYETGEGISWDVFQSGEMRQFDDVSTVPERYSEETPIRSELVVPVGEYGVMNIGSTESGTFDETDVSLARILGANAEAAMARADRERELARQNERLGEFASIVSHDLRNPLQVAEGHLGLLREEYDDGGDHLDTLAGALDRMERLIDHLLDLAREGQAVADPEAVDLAALADRCWETVETADATLVVDTDRTIRADPDRLRQLLENLLRNAVEHGGADVTIEVGDLDRGFYVADDGPGIPEGDRDSVFEAGYSTTDDGTGFGLSIVQEVVDAHGWIVEVTDAADGGARFAIRGVAVEA